MPLAVTNARLAEAIKIHRLSSYAEEPNTYFYAHIPHSAQFETRTLYALDPTALLGGCWSLEPSRDVSYTCWTINGVKAVNCREGGRGGLRV